MTHRKWRDFPCTLILAGAAIAISTGAFAQYQDPSHPVMSVPIPPECFDPVTGRFVITPENYEICAQIPPAAITRSIPFAGNGVVGVAGPPPGVPPGPPTDNGITDPNDNNDNGFPPGPPTRSGNPGNLKDVGKAAFVHGPGTFPDDGTKGQSQGTSSTGAGAQAGGVGGGASAGGGVGAQGMGQGHGAGGVGGSVGGASASAGGGIGAQGMGQGHGAGGVGHGAGGVGNN